MKISQSIIVLTSIIFFTGSMIIVGMDDKKTKNDVSMNLIEAKYKDNKVKEIDLQNDKLEREEMDSVFNNDYEVEVEKDITNKE